MALNNSTEKKKENFYEKAGSFSVASLFAVAERYGGTVHIIQKFKENR